MLSHGDLETRLLDFVRRKLVDPSDRPRVRASTALFEERLVDSLKILELIAFLEAAIGRKIPDRQVILANFRSIRTIVEVFGTNGISELPARIAENFVQGRTCLDPSTVLLESGLATWNPGGGIDLHGAALDLVQYLDSVVTAWAHELGAVEEIFADTISIDALERAGFVEAFPQKLVRVPDDDDYALPPAVCYHHYPHLKGVTLDEDGFIVTAVGQCFRNEHDAERPLERLRQFTMRELIAVGSELFVERMRADMIERVGRFIADLDLEGHVETATDPFFTAATRGRRLIQQLRPLKYELRLRVGEDGRSVAAASFNHHQDHFAKAFGIRQQNGQLAHSGCVAFGWERWVTAFVAQHGVDAESWPISTRSIHAIAR